MSGVEDPSKHKLDLGRTRPHGKDNQMKETRVGLTYFGNMKDVLKFLSFFIDQKGSSEEKRSSLLG